MVAFVELKPDHLSEKPLAFDFQVVPRPDGAMEFNVTISERGKWTFDSRPHPSLCRVEVSGMSKRVSPFPESAGAEPLVKFERQAHSIVCSFAVTEKELEDPQLCFVFRVMSERFGSGTLFYARLEDFVANARIKGFSKE